MSSPQYQEKRDQEPPDTSIAVEIRVDCFELYVQQTRSYEIWKRVIGMDVLFKMGQQLRVACPAAAERRLHSPGRFPPSQFWLRRTSPGRLLAPPSPRISRL